MSNAKTKKKKKIIIVSFSHTFIHYVSFISTCIIILSYIASIMNQINFFTAKLFSVIQIDFLHEIKIQNNHTYSTKC